MWIKKKIFISDKLDKLSRWLEKWQSPFSSPSAWLCSSKWDSVIRRLVRSMVIMRFLYFFVSIISLYIYVAMRLKIDSRIYFLNLAFLYFEHLFFFSNNFPWHAKCSILPFTAINLFPIFILLQIQWVVSIFWAFAFETVRNARRCTVHTLRVKCVPKLVWNTREKWFPVSITYLTQLWNK